MGIVDELLFECPNIAREVSECSGWRVVRPMAATFCYVLIAARLGRLC